MLVWRLMSLDRLLKLVSILFIFVIACTSNQQINTADSCIIFDQKKNWYKATKKSYEKWETPIALQLAIINQESSFNQFAKPERKKFLGIFPGSRPSTAFGYAQVTNPTWEWYKTKTGNNNASRANFSDVTDFIGWYTTQSKNIIGISKKDFYNQYLAYHEGQGGWKKKSYLKKKWLIEVAKNVERNAKMYNNQLKDCENSLNRKGFFGIF
ncbi:MAG: transglycosylase SLT domain-containing protein [Pelagibacteraceae bacterium]|nr:transglycosylase SLT domain-containing protein [Pelagibacteraceae bacterium]MBT4951827.1 transglycosylase SLT domain-containing protein [Pelagibacteraceae bacterium]MBT6197454.1 transglycosylase SLT domain-containing protein [Pelagibacteraceae bacterium]